MNGENINNNINRLTSHVEDNFKFDFKYTNKNLLIYCENQDNCSIIDYQGNKYTVTDKSRVLYSTNYVCFR